MEFLGQKHMPLFKFCWILLNGKKHWATAGSTLAEEYIPLFTAMANSRADSITKCPGEK